jgi:hypothetical protein
LRAPIARARGVTNGTIGMRISSRSLRPVLVIVSVGVAGLWGLSLPVDAAMFQWTTPDGVIGITDDPGRIPEAYRSTAKPYQTPKGDGATLQRFSPDASSPATAPPPTAPTDAPPGWTPPTDAPPAGPVDQNGHDQAWWQEQVRSLKGERAGVQQERERVEQRLNKVFYFGRDTPQEQQEQAVLRKELETMDQDLARIDQRLTGGLPDEARQAGAPPGWLRE